MAAKKEISIVGAGPAGLVAAINLNRQGYKAIVHDKFDSVGGEPGWHPSIHSTPVSEKLFDYIGIDCREAFTPVTNYTKVVFGKRIEERPSHHKGGLFNTERGHRPSSLDSILYGIAVKEGVHFEWNHPWDADDLQKAPKGTILASGLSAGVYKWLDIPCSVFSGYWAYSEIEKDTISASSYFGSFSNEYGYTGAMNGIWYVLLFARKDVSEENLAAFKQELFEVEGRSFEQWRRFGGFTPKGPRLHYKDFILTGTVGGFVEPAFGFGITGALLSGKISAMAVYDPAGAEKEFHRFTDGIVSHIARKRQPGYKPEATMGDIWFDVK